MIKKLLLLVVLVGVAIGCASTKGPETRSAEDVFKNAVELYKDDDLREAAKLFDLITLQYSVSQYADDSQYYLGEIYFKNGEFIQAAYKYNLLRRIYPSSEYSKECLFRAAMCYFEMSPTFDRDQEYTKKAIESFQEFQYVYPDDSLYHEASKKIMTLRNKLAEREYFTGNLYMKMDSPNSAVIYFDYILNNFNDTDFYEPSFYGKINALYIMKKYEQIKGLIPIYKQKFPNGANLSAVNLISDNIK